MASRLAGNQGAKFAARRAEVATSATRALAELGYAHASMRDIAQACGTSLGILHYYFDDKTDLVTCSVQSYKAQFVDRYTLVAIEADSGEAFKRRIKDALQATLVEDCVMHRLWYDLRNQSLFDDHYTNIVRQIDDRLCDLVWRTLCTYAELTRRTIRFAPAVVYATADGLFERALHETLTGDTDAPGRLSCQITGLMDDFVG